MSHLDSAKALVSEHIAASTHVLTLLNALASNGAATTQAAVASATADLTGANDLLTQQINASLMQLQEMIAQHAGVAAAGAAASEPAASVVL